MSFFNSDDTPVENPVSRPNLTDELLRAVENLSPGSSVKVAVPEGMKTIEWVPIFNQCYLRRGDFAHLDKNIHADKNEDDGIVIILTNKSPKPEPPITPPLEKPYFPHKVPRPLPDASSKEDRS